MTRKRVVLRLALADLVVFAIFHSLLSAGLLLLYRDMRMVYSSLVLLLPFFTMTFLRKRVDNFFLFMLGHLGLIALPLVVPLPLGYAALAFLLLLAGGIYSTAVRIRGDWNVSGGAVIAGLVEMVFLHQLLKHFGIPQLGNLLIAWSFIMIVCFLLVSQTKQVDFSLDLLSNKTSQPMGTILHHNNSAIWTFVGLVTVVSAFAFFEPLGRLLQTAGSYLYLALQWLVRKLASLISGGEPVPPLEEMSPPPSGTQGMDIPPAAQAPHWLQALLNFLDNALYYLMHAVIFVGIPLLLIYGMYRLYRRFQQTQNEDDDVRETLEPTLRSEKSGSLLDSLKARFPLFGRSENQRIRRNYYRTVRKHIRQGVDIRPSDTTGEIETKIQPTEDISHLTSQYNKARYGKDTE